jgi:hypothetical protein
MERLRIFSKKSKGICYIFLRISGLFSPSAWKESESPSSLYVILPLVKEALHSPFIPDFSPFKDAVLSSRISMVSMDILASESTSTGPITSPPFKIHVLLIEIFPSAIRKLIS